MQTCADAVRETAKAAGTASIHKGNNIERALRDVEVTSHHAFGSEGRYASVAQAYWGLDVDITPKLKMVGEAFYDPFFLDINNRSNDDDDCNSFSECIYGGNYTYEISESASITKDDFKPIRPIHFDFGFIYAINEHFRFGIHSQPYIIAFYWKF